MTWPVLINFGPRRHPRWGTRLTYVSIFGAPPGYYRSLSIVILGWGLRIDVLRRGPAAAGFPPHGTYTRWRFPSWDSLDRLDRRMERRS